MKRAITIIAVVLLTGVVVGAVAKQSEGKPFKLSCVLFDHRDNQIVLTGHVRAGKLQGWFKSDYAVGGERVETPKNATAFGALVVTDGDDILTMPCYTWNVEQLTYFACQSHQIGHAPMFTVIETSEEAFVMSMKKRLNEIGEAEQTPERDK